MEAAGEVCPDFLTLIVSSPRIEAGLRIFIDIQAMFCLFYIPLGAEKDVTGSLTVYGYIDVALSRA